MLKPRIFVVLALGMCLLGCKKKLPPEQASILLMPKKYFATVTCRLDGPAHVFEFPGKDTEVYRFGRAWGEAAHELGMIGEVTCDAADACKAPLRATAKCAAAERVGHIEDPFRRGSCIFEKECGSTALRIDSIVTEDRRATIAYTITPTVDEKATAVVGKLKSTTEYKVQLTGDEPVSGRAVAVLSDEGTWRLEN